MKKNIYILIAFPLFLFFSCQKTELKTYDADANVYFDLSAEARDSIVYTFAYEMTKASDTLYIPVRLMGNRLGKQRHFEVYVEKDSSTARSKEHYESLSSEYPLEADQGSGHVALIIHNTKDLEEKSVSLILKLKTSPDFGIDDPRLIRAYIVLSARLEKPNWWGNWPLGEYSRVRHQLFFIATEQRQLSTEGLDAPKNLYFANLLTIMLNDPFKWVADHPEKGYVLESKDNGQSYVFYHKDNPNRPILLKKNTGVGKFFFIDESGKELR
ncbi:hypothetical protein D3C87_960770 [compost metagenome]|uniref:DUF4843 domain-containing protein n=1 Tax=Sphingobacterium detergens TaxID=1145106 RepID=UPI000F976504